MALRDTSVGSTPYEADNPEAIREAARRLNIPADAIIEVGEVPANAPVTKWSVLR
jgi:hypothetical protein